MEPKALKRCGHCRPACWNPRRNCSHGSRATWALLKDRWRVRKVLIAIRLMRKSYKQHRLQDVPQQGPTASPVCPACALSISSERLNSLIAT